MNKIAIFASGSGTNAEAIIQYFIYIPEVTVVLVLTNNPGAGVIQRAKKLDVPVQVFSKEDLYETNMVAETLRTMAVDYIVLAGFLWLMPAALVKAYEGRIINIHPALLPDYGGKGMYGDRVHQAVIQNKEKESGITIHLVNEEYDKGQVLLQARCPVLPDDSPETLAKRIHALEHQHYPETIYRWIKNHASYPNAGR